MITLLEQWFNSSDTRNIEASTPETSVKFGWYKY